LILQLKLLAPSFASAEGHASPALHGAPEVSESLKGFFDEDTRVKMMMFFSCLSKLSTKTNCCDGCWFSTLMDTVKLDAPKILKSLDAPPTKMKFTHLKSHIQGIFVDGRCVSSTDSPAV